MSATDPPIRRIAKTVASCVSESPAEETVWPVHSSRYARLARGANAVIGHKLTQRVRRSAGGLTLDAEAIRDCPSLAYLTGAVGDGEDEIAVGRRRAGSGRRGRRSCRRPRSGPGLVP